MNCLSVDVNIFIKQSKLDLFAGSRLVCATLDSESLSQVHAAFTVLNPSFKYAEIEWNSKNGYSPGSNVINPVMGEGTSDDRFITGCQFASNPELPTEEVNTLALVYIMYYDHDVTAENGAGADFVLIFTVNGTCFRSRFNKSLEAVVMKKS